jgi:hypothetical protein
VVDDGNNSYEIFKGSMIFDTYSNRETNIDTSLFESLVSTEKIFGTNILVYKF